MTSLREELLAIDRAEADNADVGKVSAGQSRVSDAEKAAGLAANGEPGGTIDCPGCGFRLTADRTKCPKCNTGVHVENAAPDRRAMQLAAHQKRIRAELPDIDDPGHNDSPATRAGKATGCAAGTAGYMAAYMKVYNKTNTIRRRPERRKPVPKGKFKQTPREVANASGFPKGSREHKVIYMIEYNRQHRKTAKQAKAHNAAQRLRRETAKVRAGKI